MSRRSKKPSVVQIVSAVIAVGAFVTMGILLVL
mgnify:CR=1 FL=1